MTEHTGIPAYNAPEMAAPPAESGRDLILEMTGIMKVFPGVVALDQTWLRVGQGEVHVIVGQNGAGKSTLMKILNGAYHRDGGTVRFQGRDVSYRNTHEAQSDGISTIFQEINLIGYRSVAENIFMGREPRRLGLINWGTINRQSSQILEALGIHLNAKQPLMNLNIAMQQMVAIARAVSFGARLVIMDEPTSSLAENEAATLFDTIRSLKAQGVSIIYISHRLDELHQVGDRITIMRDGRTIEEKKLDQISKLEIVATMLGKNIGELVRQGTTGFTGHKSPLPFEPVLSAKHIARGRSLSNASVDIVPGGIVGLAGLLGSGRTELARILFGADHRDDGEILLHGAAVNIDSPEAAIKARIGYCSEDRKGEGIVPLMSVKENLTLAALPALSSNGVVDKQAQSDMVDRYIELLDIKTSSPDQAISQLSGGNQQKVLLARWLCLNPEILLLDEPTRGIDVGAKAEIHQLIESMAAEGLAVMMITSEMEEIVEGSNHVTVLRDGATVANMEGADINQDAIITAMAHGESDQMPIEAPG